MNRRKLIGAALALPVLGLAPAAAQTDAAGTSLPPDHPLQSSWQAWKTLCLSPEGRVVDGFQQNASHSEGQGYGLVLAAMFGDAEAAARIIRWTEDNLALRNDALLAWRWLPDATPNVGDRNNASDGDLFYAWGLLLAVPLGEGAARQARAARIAADLVRLCVVADPDGSGQPVMLPGATGFVRAEGVVVNPSYPMPLALRVLAQSFDQPILEQLADSSEALADRLAAQGPVPDWVTLTASGPQPAPAPFSQRSGYEAIRVALFALWSGSGLGTVVRDHAIRTTGAEAEGGTPVVFDTVGAGIVERSGHPGYAAVAALCACAAADGVGSTMPAFTADQPYYPATLHLMALLVQVTTYPRCVPI